jgi:predicted PhzF superfamily epimerase YddE/YHI9
MSLPLYHVNAFSLKPFAGNPAAVCLLPRMRADDWMQHVAAQMNLSETAFVAPRADGLDLRWFTPAVEVDLCGHATLASAHVLWEAGRLAPDKPARFFTRSGWLTCTRVGPWIDMDFPARPAEPCPAPPQLGRALGAAVKESGRNGMDWLVEVESEAVLRALRPDFALLATLPVRGVIVTSRPQSGEYDFVSRFFAPAAGIAEDPVTGSAHCCLGPYWGGRLGKDELLGYQASARGGEVRVRLAGDRVSLGGQAYTVLRGELTP